MSEHPIYRLALAAFAADAAEPPTMTLRGGSEVDSYDHAPPYDRGLDALTDAYLEQHAYWGLVYLDARSWRHYLPALIDYALRRPDDPAMVVEALIASLRPPDRYPPRLASLVVGQEAAVVRFLEHVALAGDHPHLEEDARRALEEWWLPGALLRPTPDELAALRSAPTTYREAGHDVYRLTLPSTLAGSGQRNIPQESRRVETWGGYLCGDGHTMVAVNVTPLAVASLDEWLAKRRTLFPRPAREQNAEVPGAREAARLDGLTGESPAEPQTLTLLLATTVDELVTLTVRAWPREDVAREVERIVASLRLV